MSPATPGVPTVLVRHGVAPDADAATLLAELGARGWEARVEELPVPHAGGTGRAPRFRALAFRARPREEVAAVPGYHLSHRHLQGGGRTAEAALARVLAAALGQEG